MTVAEAIVLLSQMPSDAKLVRVGGEYQGHWEYVSEIRYSESTYIDQPYKSVLFK